DLLDRLVEASRRLTCLGLFCAHPTRLRYTTFWDVLNFFRGENTPPEQYRFAPRRSDEEYAAALRNLRRMIGAVRELPSVEIISTRELNRLFREEGGPVPWHSLAKLAEAVLSHEGIAAGYPTGTASGWVSAATALDLLARAIVRRADAPPPAYLLARAVLGPTAPAPELAKSFLMSREAFVELCRDLTDRIGATGRLPDTVMLDELPIGPGVMLKACAAVFLAEETGRDSTLVELAPAPGEPDIAAKLAEEAIHAKLPNWPPHRPDLRLDLLALHTRLQSWSLAPARPL
ncbi:MAG: hypothetical protein WHX53_14980, partial [Anaerolineae bacterium]